MTTPIQAEVAEPLPLPFVLFADPQNSGPLRPRPFFNHAAALYLEPSWLDPLHWWALWLEEDPTRALVVSLREGGWGLWASKGSAVDGFSIGRVLSGYQSPAGGARCSSWCHQSPCSALRGIETRQAAVTSTGAWSLVCHAPSLGVALEPCILEEAGAVGLLSTIGRFAADHAAADPLVVLAYLHGRWALWASLGVVSPIGLAIGVLAGQTLTTACMDELTEVRIVRRDLWQPLPADFGPLLRDLCPRWRLRFGVPAPRCVLVAKGSPS